VKSQCRMNINVQTDLRVGLRPCKRELLYLGRKCEKSSEQRIWISDYKYIPLSVTFTSCHFAALNLHPRVNVGTENDKH
jgi:hypothetical protein